MCIGMLSGPCHTPYERLTLDLCSNTDAHVCTHVYTHVDTHACTLDPFVFFAPRTNSADDLSFRF